MIPKKWSQGQIFAFSALDGETCFNEDYPGMLCGDKIGVRFYTGIVRELALVHQRSTHPEFTAVTGDYIAMESRQGPMYMIYAKRYLVIGKSAGKAYAKVNVEGPANIYMQGNIEIHDTEDGQFSAICREGERFAFAFGNSAEEAALRCQEGLAIDLEEEAAKKGRFFEAHSLPADAPYAPLYAKCLSAMKTQLYSPEGMFKRIWSTPDRLPHRMLWLWDSVFHAIGFRNIDPALGEEVLLAALDMQQENGFIPICATPDAPRQSTQPPVVAWGALLVYEKSKNKDFLRKVFAANKKYLLWVQANRRDTEEELYTWLTDDDVNCRCGESGMDNSPRFDIQSRLQAIDLSCFMANEARVMKEIAEILDLPEEAAFFADWFEKIKTAVNEKLWDETDQFYYDYDQSANALHKVQSVASFLPLLAGICEEKHAEALKKHLLDPETFHTPFPIPSISMKDATFGSDMWRGPVWINYNYMVAAGLKTYGYADLAEEIVQKTIDCLNKWFCRKGLVYEFYDCMDELPPDRLYRKGEVHEPYDIWVRPQSIRDYGWSNTLLLDLIHNLKDWK